MFWALLCRCHGTVLAHIGRWEESLRSLASAQAIDFNPDTEPLRKTVSAKVAVIEAEKAQQRIADEVSGTEMSYSRHFIEHVFVVFQGNFARESEKAA